MNTEAIRHLLNAAKSAPFLDSHVAKLIIKLCEVTAHSIYLTVEEQYEGQHRGKLACVKLYKERTGKSLIDSKNDCEKYFEINGLKFDNH
jgi:hypothetical protein